MVSKMNEEQNIAIEGVLKLYTASMLNDIKKDPLKAVNKIQENIAEILKLKIEKNNLQNRIDKAIELLKEKVKVIPFDENGEGGGLELTDYDIQDLLDILKENGE